MRCELPASWSHGSGSAVPLNRTVFSGWTTTAEAVMSGRFNYYFGLFGRQSRNLLPPSARIAAGVEWRSMAIESGRWRNDSRPRCLLLLALPLFTPASPALSHFRSPRSPLGCALAHAHSGSALPLCVYLGFLCNRVVYALVRAGERLIGFGASAAIALLACVKSLNASRGRLCARFRSAWSVSVEFSAWPIFWPMFRSR